MKKVLYVHGGLLNLGGTEAVMMNYLRNFNHDLLQVDFALHGFGTGIYDSEVLNFGGKIFNVTPKGVNYKKNIKNLTEIIKNGNYSAVHSHIDAGNATVLKIAKKCGVPIRISHSHNTATQTNNPLKKIYNFFEKKKIKRYATHLFACSDLAGKWLYGKSDFTVINNAINAKKFEFSNEFRSKVRNKLGAFEKTTVIGHIGRFSYQKNHEKLLEIFKCFKKDNPDSILVMIGDGEKKDEIVALSKSLEIYDSVRFIPPSDRINEYLQGFDVFCMPSRFEGLPVVAVEAQAAGLPIILSNNVSKSTKLTDLASFVDLNGDNKQWCNAINNALKTHRTSRYNELQKLGFDIVDNAKKMQDFYLTGELFL